MPFQAKRNHAGSTWIPDQPAVRHLGAALSRQDVKTAFADWNKESEREQAKKQSGSAVGGREPKD